MSRTGSKIGPGVLVTAAFVGPGTVTTSTLAGANFGYALIWVLVFATLATVVLQEMSARLGLVTGRGLGENLALLLDNSVLRWPLILLVGVALYLGNAAYEAGNLSGAALGIEAIVGERAWVFEIAIAMIALLAGAILLTGSYPLIERALMLLVAMMVLSFFATFVFVGPDLGAMAAGLFRPSIPEGSLLTVLALIGTTIVPYNLFLHASAVRRKWSDPEHLSEVRADTAISIGIGGLIAILIVATAAASLFSAGLSVTNAADMAGQLEPLFGPFAKIMLGLGLFAAGLTSAITAPLATGYAVTEVIGWQREQTGRAFRLIALSVLLVGVGLSLAGVRPIEVILAAQFANGLLLPIIAGFLLYAMNQTELLKTHTNRWLANCAGGIVVLVTVGLGFRLIFNTLS
jgi:NRAMP (natural resistance-associated macrophage protein)-like metal ion transporter